MPAKDVTPNEVTLPCDASIFEKVRGFVRQKAVEAGFNQREVGRFILAADEACSNIVKHAYHFDPHHKLTLSWHLRDEDAMLQIEDDSPVPYLPSRNDFDLPTKIKYRHTNGYGKYLINRVVDDVQYETIPGSHNKVSLIKFRKDQISRRSKDPQLNPYDIARVRSLSLQTLYEVGESLGRQENPEELMKILLYSIMGRLTTHPVVILAPLHPTAPFVVVGEVGLSKKRDIAELALPRHGWVVETLWAQRGPFLVEEFRRLKIPREELETLDSLNVVLLVPLFVLRGLRGIVALGSKRSGKTFSEDDVKLVSFLANYVLLLKEGLERGTSSYPVTPGGDFRAAVRAAIARLGQACRESKIEIDFDDSRGIPQVEMEPEFLQKVVFTLLTHILYLTQEGEGISLKLESLQGAGSLTILYNGTPLSFEKGKVGYNPLIDQIMTGTMRLKECRKAIEGRGGEITTDSKGEKVVVTFKAPHLKKVS